MPIQEGGTFAPTNTIVSPGVFTRENDLSGLAQGVANIGGAVVAPFADGPAYFPYTITDITTLESVFGVADGVYYGPYTAKQYLQQQGIVTVVRIGGLTGYWQKSPLFVYAIPGTWNRNADKGALTPNSFIYIDSNNYNATLDYQHSSSVLRITGSANQLGGNAVQKGISGSTFAKVTNSQINAFLVSLPGYPTSTLVSNLSTSMAASASKGKLFSVTTANYGSNFNTQATAAGYQVTPSGGSSGYTLANFDSEKSRISGSVVLTNDTQSIVMVVDSAGSCKVGGTSAGATPVAVPSYLASLSSSITQNGSNITYGFVFARVLSASITQNNNVNYSGYNFTSATFTGSLSSSVRFEARHDTSRLIIKNADVSATFGSLAGTTAVNDTTINASSSLQSLSGSVLYAGKTVNVGTIEDVVILKRAGIGLSLPYFFLTSSVQGKYLTTEENAIATAFDESTTTSVLLSSSLFNVNIEPIAANINVQGGTVLNLVSGSVRSVRGSGTCIAGLQLRGVISGAFGKYNGTFTNADAASGDPCFPNTDGRQKMILAVLANTQNASTQFSEDFEVYGFNGSTVSQHTSSVAPYKGLINPLENVYNLALKYSFVNPDGTTSSGTYGYYDFSLNEVDNNYIKDVFGTNPTVGNPAKQIAGQKVEAAYNYLIFEDSIKKFAAEKANALGWTLSVGTSALSTETITGEPLKFVDEFSTNLNGGDSQFSITNAKTPWILSQKIAPFKGSIDADAKPVKFKLFKLHTLSDGNRANKKFKIEISNVKLAGTVTGTDWGTFTLAVRAYSDTDKKPKYLEIYQNCSLDPDSPNFIARKIGDRYAYITYAGKIIQFGTYNNLSRYVRVEIADTSYPSSVVPYGFEAYSTPIDSTANAYVPTVKYSKASIFGSAPGKYPSGTVFNEVPAADAEVALLYPTSSLGVGVQNDTKQYFNPLPYFGSVDQNGSNVDFDLEAKVWGTGEAKFYAQGVAASTGSYLAPSLSGSIPAAYDPVRETTYALMRKFVVGFQGGFDGQWPAIPINVGSDITAGNTQGLNCTDITTAGSIGYKQAVGSLGNADEFDINLIVTPGIFREQHSYVTQLVIDMCETRQDCFYIMDNVVFPASNQTVGLIDAAINTVSTIDSNYVATYYPWVKILDTNLNKIVSVPPSVVLPSVYAANDNSAAEWFAPAGLNRGGIPQAVQVLDRVTHSERDTLYEGRVNPIAAFPGQGICVWGQKTLQQTPSALDRINVRRLLINIKKFIASTSNYLVFEQNVAATRNRFLAIVTPFLESVQQRNGIYAFRVKMDDTNNTPDLIDRNILYGQIFVQPTRTAEFVILDFNILPTGASFND